MKTLVLGSTGLLGQAMTAEIARRGWPMATAARSGAEIALDIRDGEALSICLDTVRPALVVNCAALTDIGLCERQPGLAYEINARPLALLSQWSNLSQTRLVHVSTDQYFTRGGPVPHDEQAPIELVNEYARSKFAAEGFALTAHRALVLRTSIVGVRGWPQFTLAEWAIDAVLNNRPISLFTDAYTSSIDVRTFAKALVDLAVGPTVGLLNLAAREIYSKAAFVKEIAAQLDRPLGGATLASVGEQQPPRASCLGLDVGRAQAMLDYPLPSLHEVVSAVLDEYRTRSGT